ncbi:MAG: hypothetical protein ABSA71_09915 [Desulfomonilia bacterium]
MRAWYILMATFITLIMAMVILLGNLGDIQGNHWAMPSQMNGAYGAQVASRTETSAYPWQLDYITLGTKVEIAYASMPNYVLPCKDEHRVR